MLILAIIFYVLALIAAVVGFGTLAAGGAVVIGTMGKILFVAFVVLSIVSLIAGLIKGR